MMKIKVLKDTVIISGHANFANYGKDIVCASTSAIVTTSINDMYAVDKDSFIYTDDGNELIIKIIKKDALILKLFNNLIELLNNLEKDYPKNIKIESEE